MSKPKPCKFCSSTIHYPYQCYKNPDCGNYKLKRKKPGKATITWQRVKRVWLQENRQESYNCHYCGKYLLPNELTLDHYIPRSRRPDLRFEFANLVPCCWECNGRKGSKDGDEYTQIMQSLPQADKKGI